MNYNTKISVEPGLQNTYQVFNLNASQVNNHINIEVIVDGDQYIENDTPQIIHAGNSSYKLFEGINNENSNTWSLDNYGKKFKSLLIRYLGNYADTIKKSTGPDIYEDISAYKNYKNQFTVIFKDIEDNKDTSNTESTENTENTENKNTSIKGQYLGYKQNPVIADNKRYISKLLQEVNGSDKDSYIFINANIIHYSKYYNIYKSSDISVPVLQPVLYTKEDLDKLNMTISNNNVFINSLSMFTAWNDSTSTKDHRREYRYECNLKNGEFYINRQTNKNFKHDAKIEWDYSQFKQCSYGKHFVTELSEVSEEMYNSYFPNGFMFFTLSNERKRHGTIGIDFNNGKNTNNFDNSALSSWQSQFIASNYSYHISKHGYANGDGNTILAGLYYRGDKEDNVHLLNCWFTLKATEKNIEDVGNNQRVITQEISSRAYNKKPTYIGTCIASVFVNIYHYVQDSNLPITQITDTVYLSEHNTTYTKDIVYKISTFKVDSKINDPKDDSDIIDSNTLLVFKGIEYGGYVELVKQMAGVNNDSQYSGDKNVNAVIHSCVKNVPLQYKLTYKEPNTDLVNANNDFFLLKTIDNPSGTRIYGKLSTNKLYQLDYDTNGKPIIDSLKSTFKIKYLESITLDDNKIISGKFSTKFEQENNPYMCRTWDINNYLTLSNYKYLNIYDRYYSIVATNKNDFKIAFADFDKDEVLLPFAKFVS